MTASGKPGDSDAQRADVDPEAAPAAAFPEADVADTEDVAAGTVAAGTVDADGTDAGIGVDADGADAGTVDVASSDEASAAPGRVSGPPAEPATASDIVPVAGSATGPLTDYSDAGVPTLEYLQDRIDRKYSNALGATELAQSTAVRQSQVERDAELAAAAKDRLEQIRRSMHQRD